MASDEMGGVEIKQHENDLHESAKEVALHTI